MRYYTTFVKKEFIEMIKTYKLLIMGVIFILIGYMSPVMAKITPKLLESVYSNSLAGVIPDATKLDAWGQFFKNTPQIGLLILVIIFSTAVSNEISKGTLINMLTKGLPRHTVVIAKYTVILLTWTFGCIICAGIAYTCIETLFSTGEVSNLIFAIQCLWIFGILMISVMIFGSAVFEGNFGGLLSAVALLGVCLIMNINPEFKEYNVISLMMNNTKLLTKELTPADFNYSICISILLSVTFLTTSIYIFNKRKI